MQFAIQHFLYNYIVTTTTRTTQQRQHHSLNKIANDEDNEETNVLTLMRKLIISGKFKTVQGQVTHVQVQGTGTIQGQVRHVQVQGTGTSYFKVFCSG